MTFTWQDLVSSLREPETSPVFLNLIEAIGEAPKIFETPEEYNDPDGKTRFYRFVNSGIEVGFRYDRLNHIHLFPRPDDGYEAYCGPLDRGISKESNEAAVNATLGSPTCSGGGKPNALLGFRRRWIKYVRASHAVRYEFEPKNGLNKVTLIAE